MNNRKKLFPDADALDVHELCDLFTQGGIVANAHGAVVRGRGLEPLVHIFVNRGRAASLLGLAMDNDVLVVMGNP